jgi:hypothetical protein
MKTFRINKDGWWNLKEILVGSPEDFNEDLSSYYDARNDRTAYRGTLRGRKMGSGFPIPDKNWLSGKTRELFFQAWNEGRIDYIIWSYETPIAWREWPSEWVGEPIPEWIAPDDTYTRTTSKHQSAVRTAISQINGGI